MNSDKSVASAIAIIAAAGQGLRVGAGYNKLFLPLKNTTILEYTLNLFLRHPRITHTYLVISPKDRPRISSMLQKNIADLTLLDGGERRQDSVLNALNLVQSGNESPEFVLVHDAARPLCTPELINRVLDACINADAVIPTIPLVDTIRQETPRGMRVIDRSKLYATQTPQGFRCKLLWEVSQKAVLEQWEVSDDASLLENAGFSVQRVEGDCNNFKITMPEDHSRACSLIEQKEQ